MTTLFGTAAAVALALATALAAAFAAAPRDGFETEVFIAAPPATVWALLTDPAEHRALSPNLRRLEGHFAPGGRLLLTMGGPGGGEVTFHARVLAAEPGRELRWRGRLLLPRLLDGEHYFLLAAVKGGTRLVQGERFRGVLLWGMDVQAFRPEFERMNAALKARAEAVAAARAGG